MRLLIDLEAIMNASYDKSYHHKLRGRIWKGLRGTRFEELHDDSDTPSFSFSNPFPWGDIKEGETSHVLIASPHVGLLKELKHDFEANPEFNIGQMPFKVSNVSLIDTDVGETGTSGTLETMSGVYVPIEQEEWDELGLDISYNADVVSWEPDMGLGVFNSKIKSSLEWKCEQLYPEGVDFSQFSNLFESQELIKTYSLEIPVSQEHERVFVLSKWRFDYTVQNEEHRDALNTLLDVGLGWRNALGLGFVNKQGDTNE